MIVSDDSDLWKDDENTDYEEIQTKDEVFTDPLCPQVTITSKERLNLCRH